MTMTTQGSVPPIPETSNPPQTPPDDSTKLQRLYDGIGTTWITAGGVLITALTVGALRAGKLGSAPFSWQLCATIIVVVVSPALSRHDVWTKLKTWQLVCFWTTWTILCAAPVSVALIIELFTGHRRPGSNWYDGVWRIYAILAIWIFIAVAIERYVKPLWLAHSGLFLGRFRNRSVGARAQNMMMEQRAAKLETIKKKVVILLRRKKRLQSVIDSKNTELSQIQSDKDSSADEASFTERLDSLSLERDNAIEELQDVEDQIQLAQMHWTEALNVNNYRSFYR